MTIHLNIDSTAYSVDLDHSIDISIALHFNGEQPNTYNVPKATERAYEDSVFIGDTRRGGSCNFEEYKLIPHCNGTHTEGVGHITHQRISIHSILRQSFIPATFITVKPEPALETLDSYTPAKTKDDMLITCKGLLTALQNPRLGFLKGLIIRTLPNDESKKSRDYMKYPPPFFSLEAMQYVVELGVEHLLVDIPSLERMFDEGKLSTHRLFWNVPLGSHDIDPQHYSMKTVTEMIYVPNEIPDGRYLLDLQIPAFVANAAPSRPILYPVREAKA